MTMKKFYYYTNNTVIERDLAACYLLCNADYPDSRKFFSTLGNCSENAIFLTMRRLSETNLIKLCADGESIPVVAGVMLDEQLDVLIVQEPTCVETEEKEIGVDETEEKSDPAGVPDISDDEFDSEPTDDIRDDASVFEYALRPGKIADVTESDVGVFVRYPIPIVNITEIHYTRKWAKRNFDNLQYPLKIIRDSFEYGSKEIDDSGIRRCAAGLCADADNIVPSIMAKKTAMHLSVATEMQNDPYEHLSDFIYFVNANKKEFFKFIAENFNDYKYYNNYYNSYTADVHERPSLLIRAVSYKLGLRANLNEIYDGLTGEEKCYLRMLMAAFDACLGCDIRDTKNLRSNWLTLFTEYYDHDYSEARKHARIFENYINALGQDRISDYLARFRGEYKQYSEGISSAIMMFYAMLDRTNLYHDIDEILKNYNSTDVEFYTVKILYAALYGNSYLSVRQKNDYGLLYYCENAVSCPIERSVKTINADDFYKIYGLSRAHFFNDFPIRKYKDPKYNKLYNEFISDSGKVIASYKECNKKVTRYFGKSDTDEILTGPLISAIKDSGRDIADDTYDASLHGSSDQKNAAKRSKKGTKKREREHNDSPKQLSMFEVQGDRE